jgi:hypothetical protein
MSHPMTNDDRPGRSAFVPLMLLAGALAGWLVFQTVQLVGERHQLAAQAIAMAGPLDNAAKLRAQGDALVNATQALASQGNANAQRMVAELQRQGITIKTR